jgi:hypothetical protein
MNAKFSLPTWLILWIWQGLLGEVYSSIRAIAVSFSDAKCLRIRYYLDREPTDFDRESLACVVTVILSNASSNDQIRSVKEECEFSALPISQLDSLDGFVFARREL